MSQRIALFIISVTSSTIAIAHPGHGTVSHDADPAGHFLTSASHMGTVLTLGAASVAIALLIAALRHRAPSR